MSEREIKLRPIHDILDDAEASDDDLVQELGLRLDMAVVIMRKVCRVNTKILADTFLFETGEHMSDLKAEVSKGMKDAIFGDDEDDPCGIDEPLH